MKLVLRTWLALVCAGMLSLGCRAQVVERSDKNTNWLRQCSASEQCGAGLQCVCGVCTSVCDRDEQCALQATDAVCTALAGPGCGTTAPTVSVCSVSCASADVCEELDAGLMCLAGACVPEARQSDGGPGDVIASDAAPPEVDAATARPDAGTVAPPVVSGPTQDAVSSACGPGYVCDVRAAAPGDVRSFALEGSDFVAWVDFGTLDELGNHRLDGSIVRLPKAGGPPEPMHSGLDRPFRLWVQRDFYYWLSGDPADFALRRGMQVLREESFDGSVASRIVRNDLLGDLQVAGGVMFWLSPFTHETQGAGVNYRYANLEWLDGSYTEGFLPGEYTLTTADGNAAYLEHDGTDILRIGVSGMMEIVSDPPVSLAAVDGDRLWLVHRDDTDDSSDWLAWMPSTGGAITHVALAGAITGHPQPGATVVWLIRVDPLDDLYQLWSVPKTGGEPERALSWPGQGDLNPGTATPAVWIADGDDAWVHGHDAVVHVRRP